MQSTILCAIISKKVGLELPLEILGPLVVIGIAVIVLTVWKMADTSPRLLENCNQTKNIFLGDFPATQFGSECVISRNGRSALMEVSSPPDHLALIITLGSKHVTRCLGKDDIMGAIKGTGDNLSILLNELTLKSVELDCGSTDNLHTANRMLQTIGVQLNR